MDEILEQNNYFILTVREGVVFLRVLNPVYSINDFQGTLLKNPRIKITQFSMLINALRLVSVEAIPIGMYKPLIEITVSNDRLKAYARINCTEEVFLTKTKQEYLDEILELVRERGIVFGFEWQNLMDRIEPGTTILIASGLLPIKGRDSVIQYYKLNPPIPEVKEDGSVNHYEMNLINQINRGEWLGERIEAMEGIPGKTVFGEVIPAKKGEKLPLKYDHRTVEAVYHEAQGVTTLIAKKSGVVQFTNEGVSVSELIRIPDNVSFETGNIHFDGAVDIRGTIEDNFSVTASKDIQILGDLGIGAIDTITSSEGNIYIRGGIAGKDKAKIVCKGNLYTKFASNCTIICEGSVSIGFYAINCDITAKDITVESVKSKIIGGTSQAKIRVEVSEIGSQAGVKTKVIVDGFKRSDLKKEYDLLDTSIEKLKEKSAFLKKRISIYASSLHLSEENRKVYNLMLEEAEKNNHKLKIMIEEKNKCLAYLRTKGEGEINVRKRLYPNVILKIKEERVIIENPINVPMKYYFLDDEIHQS